MTLHDLSKDIQKDAQEKMDQLPKRSPAWIRQRRRRLEAHLMSISLKEYDKNFTETRRRLHELYFKPEDYE